jgi:hypothetical protein
MWHALDGLNVHTEQLSQSPKGKENTGVSKSGRGISTALNAKLVLMFKHSVRTAKKTPHFTVSNVNWLTLFKEITAVYSDNHKNR